MAAFHAAKCFASVLNARLPTPPENATKITEALSDEPHGPQKGFPAERDEIKRPGWVREGVEIIYLIRLRYGCLLSSPLTGGDFFEAVLSAPPPPPST